MTFDDVPVRGDAFSIFYKGVEIASAPSLSAAGYAIKIISAENKTDINDYIWQWNPPRREQ